MRIMSRKRSKRRAEDRRQEGVVEARLTRARKSDDECARGDSQDAYKCHETGKGGAPKIGDQAAWVPRLKPGLDVVVRSAINGHGGMPARGGMANLTDAEMRSAIVYMFNPGGGAAPKTP